MADTDNFTLRKVSPSGVVTTLAGRADILGALNKNGDRNASAPHALDGQGSEARFYELGGVVVDPVGAIYLMDTLSTF